MANSSTLLYKLCNDDALAPFMGVPGDAGIDIRCCEDVQLIPLQLTFIKTGLILTAPTNCYIRFKERSGVSTLGILVVGNSYNHNCTKELEFSVINISGNTLSVKRGDRLAQVILEKYRPITTITQVSDFDKFTDRGSKGIGSTGR